MAEVLTGMAVATFIKDTIEVWERIEQSFARVSENRRVAQRLVCDIGEDLTTLKELYDENHATLEKSIKTEKAVKPLIKKMERALQTSSELLPPKSEKRFEKYRLKYYSWKNGPKIEEELRDLRIHVNNCYQSFNTLAIARVEIGAIEHSQITCSRIDGIQNMLSDISISTHHLRAYHPAQPDISSSIVIEIPDEYLKFIISAISETWGTLVSGYLPSTKYLLPRPTIQGCDNDLFSHDREFLHRDTVAFALYTQKHIEYSWTFSHKLHHIMRLTRMARCLGMTQEADSIDFRKIVHWNIIDSYRPQIRMLAHADGGSMVLSSNSEVLQHLDMYDHKVDLFFQLSEHHSDAVYESEALSTTINEACLHISYFYMGIQGFLPEVDEIQREIVNLQRYARWITKLNKTLPPLDI